MYGNNLIKAENPIGRFCFSIKRKGWKFLSAFFVISLVSGCASVPLPDVEPINIDRFPAYIMPDGTKIYPSSIDETVPDIDILAINDDVKSLIEEKVKKIRNYEDRVVMLTKILVQKIQYDTLDDAYGVQTAQETFDTGTGNCLSFSNLFIAMARYAGFKSRFFEIPTLPNWTREGDILFFTRHIGASIDIHNYYTQLIQLDLSENGSRVLSMDRATRYFFAPSELAPENPGINTFGFRSIPDYRAFAQFYNNLGSKKLAEGNAPEAFRYFIKAIKTDPKLSFAWSNLGVIYRRNNQLDTAEAAYLQGLAVTQGSKDTSVLTIMNNLENLYDITGENEKALLYKTYVASFREKNPYYQYISGKTAYDDSLFEKSVGLFKRAIRLKDDEHLFYYGLALAYFKTGEIKKAERNIDRAISHTWKERDKEYYKKVRDIIKNDN
ncbi:MAG: tetratricopeptide repeat protein [Desulfobacteraceae bacterium]|jgi:Flp pilus assembly protein TadD